MTQGKVVEIGEELKGFIGKEMARRDSYPVSASDIRKWAIAIYWPEKPPRLFWDEEYAKKTRFGGIVAPEDFNPFAWPTEPGQTFLTDADLKEPTERLGIGWNVLNGGGGNEYFERIRPGDVIESVTRLADIYTRPGKLGTMIFFIRESTWTNEKGQVVRISRGTGIRY